MANRRAIYSSPIKRRIISKTDRLVESIRSVSPNSKGPKAVQEQEIVIRKRFFSLDEACRYDLANALASIGYNHLGQQLLMNVLWSDSSPLVRHEAAFALGWIGDKSSVPVLAHALLNDESFLVRHEAAMALGELRSDRAIQTLREGLKDKSREVVISCKVALQRLRKKQPPLTQNEGV